MTKEYDDRDWTDEQVKKYYEWKKEQDHLRDTEGRANRHKNGGEIFIPSTETDNS